MTATSDLVLAARVAGSLVVVVLLALLAGRWARRSSVRAGGEDLRVVQRLGLSREAGAVVLDVGGRRLLLGVTSHAVNVLAELGAGGTVLTVATGPAPAPDAVALALDSLAPDALALERPVPPEAALPTAIPAQREALPDQPLTRRALRQAAGRRRLAVPPTQRGTGSAVDPRTWAQALEALRDMTARKG